MQNNQIVNTDDIITLYHGSKSGIHGDIAPISREHCDFGSGFYMGTERTQPLTLVCNYPGSRLYTLRVHLSGLKLLDIEVGIDWALFIAYHRGKMESARDSAIYRKVSEWGRGCDIIIGSIANDRMFVVLDRFFRGEITDLALIQSLSTLKLGRQYVAVSDKACKNIEILQEQVISEEDRLRLKQESEKNRLEGIIRAEEICRKYRREGRFFDEILEAGE